MFVQVKTLEQIRQDHPDMAEEMGLNDLAQLYSADDMSNLYTPVRDDEGHDAVYVKQLSGPVGCVADVTMAVWIENRLYGSDVVPVLTANNMMYVAVLNASDLDDNVPEWL